MTMCKLESQWELQHDSGNSNPLSNNPEKWDGEGVGRDVKWEGTWVNLWPIHVAVW